MILEKDNAVADFRTLIGATDPAKAEKGTIRNLLPKTLKPMPYMAQMPTKLPATKAISFSLLLKGFSLRIKI